MRERVRVRVREGAWLARMVERSIDFLRDLVTRKDATSDERLPARQPLAAVEAKT